MNKGGTKYDEKRRKVRRVRLDLDRVMRGLGRRVQDSLDAKFGKEPNPKTLWYNWGR